MPVGNGAYIVHQQLRDHMPGYVLSGYRPAATLFPPLLWSHCRSGSKAGIVHTTPDHASFFADRGDYLVVSFHNYVLDRAMQPYGSLLQRLHWRTDLRWLTLDALRRAHVVTAVSEYTAGIVREDLGVKSEVRTIANGVDADMFQPSIKRRDGVVRVLFSGNWSLRKGGQWLLEIASRLGPGIELVCTGGLRGMDKSRMTDGIAYLGKVPYENMPELYRDVDILLLPTVREGLSLAVLEAMASGLPVVSSRCSSLPEQIVDGLGGFLVEPGNVAGYADAINHLAESRKVLSEMGDFNRQRVQSRFTLDRMVREYRLLFESVLDGAFAH